MSLLSNWSFDRLVNAVLSEMPETVVEPCYDANGVTFRNPLTGKLVVKVLVYGEGPAIEAFAHSPAEWRLLEVVTTAVLTQVR